MALRRFARSSSSSRALAKLCEHLPASGKLLEVGSGTGAHLAEWSALLPGWDLHPSEADESLLSEIASHAYGLPNVQLSVQIDAASDEWPIAPPVDAIVAVNVLHAVEALHGLFEGAADAAHGCALPVRAVPAVGDCRSLGSRLLGASLWLKDERYGLAIRGCCSRRPRLPAGAVAERQVGEVYFLASRSDGPAADAVPPGRAGAGASRRRRRAAAAAAAAPAAAAVVDSGGGQGCGAGAPAAVGVVCARSAAARAAAAARMAAAARATAARVAAARWWWRGGGAGGGGAGAARVAAAGRRGARQRRRVGVRARGARGAAARASRRCPRPRRLASPIGLVRSPYTLRYGARASRLAAAAGGGGVGTIRLFEGLGLEASVRDLAGFEYVRLLYAFHANEGWRLLVPLPHAPPPTPPPREERGAAAKAAAAHEGAGRRPRRVGVLSSRAPHRPNPLVCCGCCGPRGSSSPSGSTASTARPCSTSSRTAAPTLSQRAGGLARRRRLR